MTQQALKINTQIDRDAEKELMDNWMKLNPEQLTIIGQIQRCIERYEADAEFRHNILIEPQKTLDRYNLKLDPQAIRWLFDREFYEQQQTQGKPLPQSIQLYSNYNEAVTKWMRRWRDLTPQSDPRFQAWRERQMARADSEISKTGNVQIVHAPATFELSKGCSVGCWFCGISAPRFSDIFTYTPENAQLWRQTLAIVTEICGSATESGFCYWATDPFDNPDYEKFISDFQTIVGILPQTTTAQPLKDVKRTKAFLQFAQANGFVHNRFSILSLKILENLYQQFTPEELVHVGLVLQNPESVMNKAVAGRALEKKQKKSSQHPQPTKTPSAPSTIACVTGFLFNMVDRSVQLISPCKADERWPNGYRIYDRGTFNDAQDLKLLLERMISTHMPLEIRSTDTIRFRRDLKHETLIDGFKLSSPFLTLKFRNRPFLKELGEIIDRGDRTAEQIATYLETLGASKENTFASLSLMFKRGVLDDEPV